MSNNIERLSYRQAGVDIEAGNTLVEQIKPIAARTHRPGVMTGLGGFGSLFELPLERFKTPVLVSGTDGVGTKLKLALELGSHQTIGIDLVAMCVNDIVTLGAEPLFFLDYYATGKLDIEVAAAVMRGIGAGCELAGAALVGGETAEMPGMYQGGDYDLAGFCVGIVEKERIVDGHAVQPGDRLIGIRSSGPHANGFSLIRAILQRSGGSIDQELDGRPLGQYLIEPTRIYVQSLLELLDTVEVHAIAHITGGGISENLPRVLKNGLGAEVELSAWQQGAVFDWLQQQGNIEPNEMLRTFNCGIGIVVVVPQDQVTATVQQLELSGELVIEIGEVVSSDGPPSVKYGSLY